MRGYQLTEDVSALATQIEKKYELNSFMAYENADTITLSMIEVPKANRKQGVGSAVMNELIQYADKVNKVIVLTPGQRDDKHGTTSRSRLVQFYKRFGFVENKGRNKDFQYYGDTMYRTPV